MASDGYFPPAVGTVLDAKAAKRDKDVLLARNTARIEITNLLHQIGFSVSSIAKGSQEILSSSGFPFTQPPQKSTPMQKPPPPKIFAGINNGAIGCKTTRQKGMK